MYACIHTHTNIYTNTNTHTNTNTNTQTLTQIFAPQHGIKTHTHACAHTHTKTRGRTMEELVRGAHAHIYRIRGSAEWEREIQIYACMCLYLEPAQELLGANTQLRTNSQGIFETL
jgi:hypothetical protein